MRSSIIGVATLLVVGCASQPPTKPVGIDPSNPAAAESPAPTLTPLVGTREEARSAPSTAPSAAAEKAQPKEAATYTCPMHPEISSPKPGKCPKCGMKLVLKTPDAAPGGQK
jgi:Heavy metal binding domain